MESKVSGFLNLRNKGLGGIHVFREFMFRELGLGVGILRTSGLGGM